MDVLVKMSIVLLIGVVGGRVAKKLNLPNVTGYLIGGLLVGPSFINVITDADVTKFSLVNDIALCTIAFSIGSEFSIKELKKVGSKIFVVTLWESLFAVVCVFATSYFILRQSFELSIVMGAIAAATAPAATTMVIKQYKADGPLTKTILPIVAIDDAVCVMSFGIAMAVARISLGKADTSFLQMMIQPVIEIVGSIALGLLLGVLLVWIGKRASNSDEIMAITLGVCIAGAGLANTLHLSPILLCMALGAAVVNLISSPRRIFDSINSFTPPIYVFFFTLAGAGLHLNVLGQLGLLGIGYVVARSFGKIVGAGLGAKLVGYSDVIVKNLGLGLLPQAGVAIGLAMLAKQRFPEIGNQLSTIILGGVLIYELIGPVLAKYAIERAGEINA